MLFISSLFALLSLPLVFGKNYNVDVGREGVAFTPNRIQNVVKGDTVTFHVINGEHTITQSTLTVPCTHSNAGFDSGIVDAGETFKIDIKDTEPIWVFCRTRGHCPAGMVFAVNPGDKFSQFQNNAAGSGVHPTLSPSSITDSLTSPTTTISSTSDSGSPLPSSSSSSSTSTTRLTGSDEGTTTRTVSTPAASAITTIPASNNNGVGLSSFPLLAPVTLLATLLGLGMAIVF
ncbi:hypothetical protein FRC14_008276 [Serendipita sp. 396]|nr:hypothetical protein FRC14_008276 [Serendipita sp. 396]KAG8776043.1 hypothetical protein FRC15_000173 [Serendipita sp. 397]KAG8792537.1 hypothetical protein FRC16_011379 [Serendipita sp. 398]KAG8819694.1 hypothetical protein FRC18_011947 [Serendipita sp. 400]KAG8847092.1 hypothetical protein FRB91_000201 [Serendipita sp. 411]KAG8858214.1 hypothetical protein FRC20_012051 [Serendipita sp. 405]